EWSETVLPEAIGFWRGMAPVRARMASRRVVLPLEKGPTMAMHFGPERLPPARYSMTDLRAGVFPGSGGRPVRPSRDFYSLSWRTSSHGFSGRARKIGDCRSQQADKGGSENRRRTEMKIIPIGSVPSKVASDAYFTGRVRIDPIIEAEAPARLRAASVSFEPGARTHWHTHPFGQT